MNRLTILISAFLLILTGSNVYAQKNKPENDHNLKKAYEVLQEEKDEAKALDLMTKQLRETPDNVEALLLRMKIYYYRGEYGHALKDINHALKVNKPKKTEIQNSTLHWWKAYICQDMGDNQNAAISFRVAYELAQKEDRENLQSVALDYAQALFHLRDYEGADAIYRQLLAMDEADQPAMVGLARNMIERGQYKNAIEMLEKCQKYNAGYSEIYRFKMFAYEKLGETNRAIDAGLEWYDTEEEAYADDLIRILKMNPNYAEARIIAKQKMSDKRLAWESLICYFYDQTRRYADAIKAYDILENDFGQSDRVKRFRSECYSELGLYELAIADITKAMENEADWEELCCRGDYYRLSGNLDAAIADFSAAIDAAPWIAYSYYKRGWCYELKGDYQKALEDDNLGIEIDPEYPYTYLMRGELLLLDGNKAGAMEDFKKVVMLDTLAEAGSCRQYALHFLGRDREAIEWMDKIVASDPDDAGLYYDQACLYARMGRLEESVAALRVSFEKGYRGFVHIRLDDDMDPIRNLPEFKSLVGEYEAKHAEFKREFLLSLPYQKTADTVPPYSSGVTFSQPFYKI